MTVTIGRFIRRALERYLILYYNIITVQFTSTNIFYTLPRRFKAEFKVPT